MKGGKPSKASSTALGTGGAFTATFKAEFKAVKERGEFNEVALKRINKLLDNLNLDGIRREVDAVNRGLQERALQSQIEGIVMDQQKANLDVRSQMSAQS